MNKLLLALNVLLIIAVAFLFYKISSLSSSKNETEKTETTPETKTDTSKKQIIPVAVGTTPTGKIAFLNLDVLNEKSLEVIDLIKEAKNRKASIESSLQTLSMNYEKKVQEYQVSAKAGIASENEMEAKAREIQALEKDAQNKQIQMDNLTNDIGEKNAVFQQTVKSFLVKWNNGKYDYILSYSDAVPTMLLGNATLDITTEVVDQINSEYKAKKSNSIKK
ncbi:MAG: OmpH family outer membrane protein [Bacteroidota bacterium]|nr:OmpH family outer membrane protein [Bacteroidota bacterium]